MITWSPSKDIEDECPCKSVVNYIIEKFHPILALTVESKKIHLHAHAFFISDRRQDSIKRSIEDKFGYKKVEFPHLFKVQKWKSIPEAYHYMCQNMYQGGQVWWDKGNNFLENVYPHYLERLEDQQEVIPISRRELLARIIQMQDPSVRMTDSDLDKHLINLVVKEHLDVSIQMQHFHLIKRHVNILNGHATGFMNL